MAEFEFRYNNRHNEDIFGTTIIVLVKAKKMEDLKKSRNVRLPCVILPCHFHTAMRAVRPVTTCGYSVPR